MPTQLVMAAFRVIPHHKKERKNAPGSFKESSPLGS